MVEALLEEVHAHFAESSARIDDADGDVPRRSSAKSPPVTTPQIVCGRCRTQGEATPEVAACQ